MVYIDCVIQDSYPSVYIYCITHSSSKLLQEQATKEAAAKAAMDINYPEGAKKLAQITEAAVAKRKKVF